MAKIVYFVESLSRSQATSYNAAAMINCSAELGHEVHVFTGPGGDLVKLNSSKVQVMQAFRKWSPLELPRVFPILWQLNPDIVHLIQPNRKIPMIHPMSLISSFSRSLGARVILSLFDLNIYKSRGLQALIASTPFLSASTALQEISLKKQFPRAQVLQLQFQASDDAHLESHSENLPAEVTPELPKNFIFVPYGLRFIFDTPMLFEGLGRVLMRYPDYQVYFEGSFADIGILIRRNLTTQLFNQGVLERIVWTGGLDEAGRHHYLKHAEIVLATGLRLDLLQTARLLQMIRRTQVPAIVTRVQAETAHSVTNQDFLFCEETQIKNGLEKLMASAELRENLRKNLAEKNPSEISDSFANRLNRIYAQVLT